MAAETPSESTLDRSVPQTARIWNRLLGGDVAVGRATGDVGRKP